MIRSEFKFLWVCALAVAMCVACGTSSEPASSTMVATGPTAVIEDTGTTGTDSAVADTGTADSGAVATAATDPEIQPTAGPSAGQSDAEQDAWKSAQTVQVVLDGDSVSVQGGGVRVAGSVATITTAGTYVLSGLLRDGQVVVDSQDEGIVTLVLNGVDIHCSSSAPIYVRNADKTVIVLADGADNYVSDGESYVLDSPEDDEPNAAIFSKDDLTITGSGSLTVDANYNDGIASKDDLVIVGGTIHVTSVDDGMRGKDSLTVEGGHITVNAQGDGLKADEDADDTKGYVAIESGVIDITCGGDAVQGHTAVTITGGEFVLSSGGGHNSRISESTSAKGIKAGVDVTIDGGVFTIDSADDAIHSNERIVINAGTFLLASGDDGMHADATLDINGGDIRITDSYEGIESAVITLNDGEIYIVSSDDGINVSAGNDGSGTNLGPGGGGGPGRGGRGGPGQDMFAYSGNDYLYINGGTIVIDAAGDGIDVNGSIEMTDGVVIVNGPTQSMNGALDCIGTFNIHGGSLVAAGSAGMAEGPDASSTQYSVLLNLNGTLQAGVLFHIQSSDGKTVLSFAPTKQYQSIAFSSPQLSGGATYDVYYGGSSSGTEYYGLYQGGTYTPGTNLGSYTQSSIATRLGGGRRF